VTKEIGIRLQPLRAHLSKMADDRERFNQGFIAVCGENITPNWERLRRAFPALNRTSKSAIRAMLAPSLRRK
jgi:hypothetical protein